MSSRPDPLRHLFNQALALPAGLRRDFIRRHCPEPIARARLAGLLNADSTATGQALSQERVSAAQDASASPPNAWRAGDCIGGWILGPALDDGGKATAFRAIRAVAGRTQAGVMRVLASRFDTWAAMARFRAITRSLWSLDHPGIARLIDCGIRDDGRAWLVSDDAEGRPVTAFACAAQLDLRDRLALMVAACRALSVAHRMQLPHLGLGADSLRVGSDGQVNIIGLGVALLTQAGHPDRGSRAAPPAPGSADPAAPVQWQGEGPTAAADVHAIGVILHELLLGEPPDLRRRLIASSRVDELVTDLWRLPAPRPQLRAALRGGLDRLLDRALADHPASRHRDAGELADDLARHLALPPGQVQLPAAWQRRRGDMERVPG